MLEQARHVAAVVGCLAQVCGQGTEAVVCIHDDQRLLLGLPCASRSPQAAHERGDAGHQRLLRQVGGL